MEQVGQELDQATRPASDEQSAQPAGMVDAFVCYERGEAWGSALALFNVSYLSRPDFFYMIADSAAMADQ